MKYVNWGKLVISRFILGGNPLSGFSHQGIAADSEMRNYFTAGNIKNLLRQAEDKQINTLVARIDHHIYRILLEYYDEGGSIQLLAQTCPEYKTLQYSIAKAASCGAKGCHIHGGVMDYLLAQDKLDDVIPAIDMIHSLGMAAGIAGHNPEVFLWAEKNHLPIDYYMCAYYNPDSRVTHAEHQHGVEEQYLEIDRLRMVRTIHGLNKPVIHYKILAAGRNDPRSAFVFAAKYMRSEDAVCVGVFPKNNPSILDEDIEYLINALRSQDTANSKEVQQSVP